MKKNHFYFPDNWGRASVPEFQQHVFSSWVRDVTLTGCAGHCTGCSMPGLPADHEWADNENVSKWPTRGWSTQGTIDRTYFKERAEMRSNEYLSFFFGLGGHDAASDHWYCLWRKTSLPHSRKQGWNTVSDYIFKVVCQSLLILR